MHRPVFIYRELLFAAWILWLAYWAVSAVRVKQIERRESLRSRLAYILPLVIGGWLIVVSRARLGPLSVQLWPDDTARWRCALVLVVLGLGFSIWARAHLGSNWSGTVTVKQGHELIRSGPYAYLRHPIYTGLIVALAGSAIACGEPSALLGLLIIVYSFARKLRLEEHFMREQFPGEYARYSSEVPALIPFARRRSQRAARQSARR
jgi:protein-S-isoprenylcysteine O-methyltransferase Ste14